MRKQQEKQKSNEKSILTIYGVPLSQPFRAVVWPCLIHSIPFRIEFAVPFSKSQTNGTKSDSYMLKFPLGTIPSIEFTDDNCKEIALSQSSLRLSESPAILSFLAAKYGVEELYPTVLKARVDEYCHWHHSNLRYLTVAFFRPAMIISHSNDSLSQKKYDARRAKKALKVIEESYLRASFENDGIFLLGTITPSAADFLAYSEIAQVGPYFGNLVPVSANVLTWIESMKKLPYHDEVHVALKYIVGDLNRANDVGISKKRLTEANMIWLKAIQNIVSEKQKSKL